MNQQPFDHWVSATHSNRRYYMYIMYFSLRCREWSTLYDEHVSDLQPVSIPFVKWSLNFMPQIEYSILYTAPLYPNYVWLTIYLKHWAKLFRSTMTQAQNSTIHNITASVILCTRQFNQQYYLYILM